MKQEYSSDTVALATVAALLMQGGKNQKDAILEARDLLDAADIEVIFRTRRNTDSSHWMPLKELLTKMDVQEKQCRKYLFKVMKRDDAKETWKIALKDRHIHQSLARRLIEEQSQAIDRRNETLRNRSKNK